MPYEIYRHWTNDMTRICREAAQLFTTPVPQESRMTTMPTNTLTEQAKQALVDQAQESGMGYGDKPAGELTLLAEALYVEGDTEAAKTVHGATAELTRLTAELAKRDDEIAALKALVESAQALVSDGYDLWHDHAAAHLANTGDPQR